MGVKFLREYKDVIYDLSNAMNIIDDIYKFFDMDKTMWNEMDSDEKYECVRTLADDIFYALGESEEIDICGALIKYDKFNSNIIVTNKSQSKIVKLV